ncbi:hypothetical protein GCM10009069_29170 [Algimonas arctica]|uniref:Type I restriction modification DNA specificity domain-containing protein n=1 Tax=Algimonas arctica TaxID=1479486 RepID=A0A8J3CUC2_9PROT|nr:restriction endonuclease subunit S [Algimonas arctica]GHB04760.1 hypothetical protein GCM10009069_29170 [Algimonas arctica]
MGLDAIDHLDVWVGATEHKPNRGRGAKSKKSDLGLNGMRQLLISLAVRGKLTHSLPSDSDAGALLASIGVERLNYDEFKIQKTATTNIGSDPGLKSTWLATNLGSCILGHLGGGTPSKTVSKYWNGDIPWASVKDIGKEKYVTCTQDSITCEGLANSSSNLVPSGCLIVVTRMGLGQLSINRVDLAINQDLRALFLPSSIDSEFMYLLMKDQVITGQGLTVKGIKLPDLLGLKFSLPPLEEQQRIVAKVDELMGLIDDLEAQTETARESHAELVDALLRTLVESKDANVLTQNWTALSTHFDALFTTEGSVSKLKATVLDLLTKGYFSRINDSTWKTCRLSEIADLQSGMAFKSSVFLKQGSNQVIRMSNMSPGKLRLKNNAVFISEPDADESKKVELATDDIIMSMTGTKGKRDYLYSVKISEEVLNDRKLFLNQRICRIRSKTCLPDYLLLSLTSNFVLDPVFDNSTGTANQANASMKSLGGMTIPVPEVREQKRLVDIFENLLALCDDLLKSIRTSESLKVELAESVVHHVSVS